jgi:thioredoxin-like negative regulator of GroEL
MPCHSVLQIIKRDKAWNAGAANQLLLKIFETLGPGNDLAKKSRARMTNLLFL